MQNSLCKITNLAASALVVYVWGTSLTQASPISDGVSNVAIEEVRKELGGVPPGVRGMMSKVQMERFITNILVDRRLEAAAVASGVKETERVKAQIERAVREVLIKAYVDQEMTEARKTLPDLEPLARERYETTKASFVQPEAIRVAHILFRIDSDDERLTADTARKMADEVLAKLKAGADFAALAKEYSADVGSAAKGGELPGWQNKGRLVPQFETAAYALKPGELSEPVRSRFGYHLIKLLAHRDAATQPFEEVKAQIMAQLQQQFMGQKHEEFLKRFQGSKPIAIDDATLQVLRKN